MQSVMKITPRTQQEAMQVGLLEKGNYEFQVRAASIETSKNGNPMIKLTIIVWDGNGIEHPIYDYLMESEGFEFKLRHFCYSIGMGEMSERGEFDCQSVINKTGQCKIYVREDKTGQWPPKNAIGDYLVVKVTPVNNDPFEHEKLPF